MLFTFTQSFFVNFPRMVFLSNKKSFCIKQILFLLKVSHFLFRRNQTKWENALCIVINKIIISQATTTGIKSQITEILLDEVSKYIRMH